MTEEKQKAIDLVDNFTQLIFESGNSVSKTMVINCAKKSVNETIKSLQRVYDKMRGIDFSLVDEIEKQKCILKELNRF